jgi:uncharacterized protein DUF4340
MKARWLVNLGLLLLIAGIVVFLHLRPEAKPEGQKSYELSALKLADFSRISIEFPAKAAVVLHKIDGYWRIVKPYEARADQMTIQRIMSIVAATSTEKFPADNLARFNLDNPKLKLKLDKEEFLFGTVNPVSGLQYVAYKDSVYLLPTTYSEIASTQVVEMVDKSPLKPTEKVVGFDFSRLEQWEDIRLHVDLVDGQWKISAAKAKPRQNDMNEWLDTWTHASASSVEPYTPDRNATFPSFEVKMKDGTKAHFDKIQESPELLLARPDEKLIYHFNADIGFSMLNPPISLPK